MPSDETNLFYLICIFSLVTQLLVIFQIVPAMVKLIHQSLSEHLSNLYNLSCNMVDTVLICKDGKLYQNNVVVQLMLNMLDSDHELDSDIIVILPDYSVQEVQIKINELFGIQRGEKDSSNVQLEQLLMSANRSNKMIDDHSFEGNHLEADLCVSTGSSKKINKISKMSNSSSKTVYKDRPKNLLCPHCPYKTYHVSNLTNHMRTHTGENPFSCQHCGETFRFSGVRNLHEKTHTGEKEYSCQYCGKEFARRYVCILHER